MTKYLLLTVLIVVAVNVWLVNFRRRRKEVRDPVLLPQEQPIMRVRLDELLSTTSGLLTSGRILRESNRWFLSKRDSQMARLEDLHSVSWQVQMNIWLLIFGALLIGLYSAVGLLLVLYALQTPIVAVGFQSHFLPTSLFSRVGLGVAQSHIVFRAGKRDQYMQLQELHEAGIAAWSKARHRDAGAQALEATLNPGRPEVVPLFAWSSIVWLSISAVFLLAHIQRFATGHVVLDHPFFGALYLGLPLAVAILEGVRSGLWSALLTFLMLLAIKFPAGFLLGWVLNDGSLHLVQAVGVFISLILIVAIGHALQKSRLGFLPGELAILLVWPLSLAYIDPGSIYSFRTLALIAMAVGLCRLSVYAIPAALASRWLAATRGFLQNVVELVWGPI